MRMLDFHMDIFLADRLRRYRSVPWRTPPPLVLVLVLVLALALVLAFVETLV